jgi:hypothetical protein
MCRWHPSERDVLFAFMEGGDGFNHRAPSLRVDPAFVGRQRSPDGYFVVNEV